MPRTVLQICVTEYNQAINGEVETSVSVNIDPLSTEEGLKEAFATTEKTREALIKLLPAASILHPLA